MKKLSALLLIPVLLLTLTACGSPSEEQLDPARPETLTMWHVYGEQSSSPMNQLVQEFNRTVGREQGVVVDVTAISNGSQIGGKLLAAQAGRPGEPDMPDLFFCHPGNAASLGPENLLDFRELFSEEELSGYVEAFLEEGTIDGRLVVFPVSKSTHLLFLNGTRFREFSQATGVTQADLATWDGFFRAAERYYDWSGGGTFCAMDYPLREMELSLLAHGGEIPMDGSWYDTSDPALRAALEPFFLSAVQGHIVLSDLFANTQVMTGETAAGLGSSAAVLYYNDVVIYPDNTIEPTDLQVLPMPSSGTGLTPITQAGVGLAARSTTPRKARAISLFTHWLMEPERNLAFVAETGYMPVSSGAFDAIDTFAFQNKTYERLFHTLHQVWETSVPVAEPAIDGYYTKVNEFHQAVRKAQPGLLDRCRAGEDPQALADELWTLFCSIG